MEEVIIMYTDGSAPNNRQANTPESYGGWGVYLKYGDMEKTLYGGTMNTSNNRMEMQAVVEGLKALKIFDIPVQIYSDSQYVVDGINKWCHSWRCQGWKSKHGGQVLNVDIWKELDDLVGKFKSIEVIKVKGHSGLAENELVDQLAKRGADQFAPKKEITSKPATTRKPRTTKAKAGDTP